MHKIALFWLHLLLLEEIKLLIPQISNICISSHIPGHQLRMRYLYPILHINIGMLCFRLRMVLMVTSQQKVSINAFKANSSSFFLASWIAVLDCINVQVVSQGCLLTYTLPLLLPNALAHLLSDLHNLKLHYYYSATPTMVFLCYGL
jgi:hypothetical protein